ncbi:MAG: Na+/H+ antiporter NhaC family protein [Clostridia bacterium]|nr:Na+/H+ antiporter NhaC family protein [Clostridia bacterium]
MAATIWSLLPPIIAIALALLTKEVYMSLMIGILSGALLFAGFNPLHAVETTFTIMGEKIGGNVNILVFLVLLGILVALITKSGASKAYGEWASRTIKTRRGALLATSLLGTLIFVDDYFNCLTVGTVMRPVTDKHGITRAKLAYVIDATAAPVCIIAPISSWAAAVGSSLPKGSHVDGFSLFLQTIPFNLYALLTLAFLAYLIISDFDFGAMKRYEERVKASGKIDAAEGAEEIPIYGNGRVFDLVLPIFVLIGTCIAAMLYTGGILEGVGVVDAFANCDSSTSLVLGSFFTLIFTFLLYLPRKILTFQQFCESFIEGFRAMAPAIMILSLAWTLSGVCSTDYLNIGGYVKTLVESGTSVLAFMPAVFFLVALGLAFATGTSWGTFGILIPIAFAIFGDNATNMLVLTVAASLSGAVCGDHVSPISDTTILASAGGQCNHIDHVSTQMPYAMIVAACSFVGYIAAGLTGNGWIGLATGFGVFLVVTVSVFERLKPRKAAK